jgi:hypothetical protein
MRTDETLGAADIFFGDANNAEARVYVQLASANLPGECRLVGRVMGPSCEYSRTLSAAVPFTMKRTSHGAGEAQPLLAEAIVPDPCFWSQELPFLYRAEIELRNGSHVLGAAEQTFGIRPLGVRGQRLVWEGRPWVLRAADARELPPRALADWRAADLAMLVERPDEELCRDASRLGAVLVADLTAGCEQPYDELRRLARWPAVAIAVLDAEQGLEMQDRAAIRNLLLAERVGTGAENSPSPWADLAICEHASASALDMRASAGALPLVAQRPAGWCDELVDARRHCDRLQRDLAGHGDFAGFIV